MGKSQENAAASSSLHVQVAAEENHKKRRRAASTRPGNESGDGSSRTHLESSSSSQLQQLSVLLSSRPDTVPAFELRLFPLSLERSAQLVQLELEEKNAIHLAHMAFEEEQQSVQKEWRIGHDRVRQRLLEGIEEGRRRAREEKDSEGIAGDASLDKSRSHVTRKLRNKLGSCPPPGDAADSGIPTAVPLVHPHSLSIDEIPSPFPLALMASGAGSASRAAAASNARKKPRRTGNSTKQDNPPAESIVQLLASAECKEVEIDNDLMEIRRAIKRRRALLGR